MRLPTKPGNRPSPNTLGCSSDNIAQFGRRAIDAPQTGGAKWPVCLLLFSSLF
jgi:hypothetical protein